MIKEKLSEILFVVKNNWKKPPEGRYMPYKEIFSLSVGGIGVKFIVYCIGQMIISTGNSLLANTIGIDPIPLYVIYILSILSSFPLTALRASLIDNSRSIKGKYRPYIITMGIPTTILGIGFILMPYESMTLIMKCIVVLLFNIGFQFFYNFYNDSYDSLINVLSPNSIERSDVLSIKSVVENFSPSIANIVFPLLAKGITGEDTLYSLKAYRYSFPPMLVAGLLISILVYVNTEEKIVQAKSHFIQISFSDALRAVIRNKYFWIISLAGWIGFLEGAFTNIIQWMYNYQGACSAEQYSIIIAISGNASFWPNLAGPFLIRKWGKKKVLILSNLLNIIFIALMLPIVRNSSTPGIIWVLLVCVFINQFMTSLGYLMNPSINADIRDYQQYITGERIDGMFSAVGLIGNVITMLTGLVLPYIYSKSGLNKEVALSLGYDGKNVYDVLYNADYFAAICTVLVIASVIGAALNVIPYFFYDLSETKQKAIVDILKLKAYFEDIENGNKVDDTEIKNIIYKSRNYDENDKKAVEYAQIISDELNKFNTQQGKYELLLAEKTVNAGLEHFDKVCIPSKKEIALIPKSTQTEKNHIRNMKLLRSTMIAAEKTRKKYFSNGLVVYDYSELEKLFEEEDRLSGTIREYQKNGENDGIKELVKQKKQVKKEIKIQTKLYSRYIRAAKPYLDAVKMLKLKENYDKISIMFYE